MPLKTLFCIIFALLSTLLPAGTQPFDGGLPADGSNIVLRASSSGYKASVVVSSGFTDVAVTSIDSVFAKLLSYVDDKDAQGQVELVEVMVNSGAVRQGNYPLTLFATGKGLPVVRHVTLSVPAVVLDPVDTLVIERQVGPGGSTVTNKPQLWESSQQGWLTGIKLVQKGETDAGDRPAGRIKTLAKIDDIAPGNNRLIEYQKHYDLDGDFPFGTAKGKLVIEADQLVEPVTFGFEVRSRIPQCWVLAPLVIGIGLGFLARNVLQHELELNQERAKSFELIDIIDEALRRNKDAQFTTDANQARSDAEAAAKKNDKDDIKIATDKARTSFQSALDELAKRRAELLAKVRILRDVVRSAWRVPPALEAKLKEVKSALEQGLPGLDSNDVDRATVALDGQGKILADQILNVGDQWLSVREDFLEVLDIVIPLLSPDAAALTSKVRSVCDSLRKALENLSAVPKPTLDLIQTALSKFQECIYAYQYEKVAVKAATLLQKHVEIWNEKLALTSLRDPAEWSSWTEGANGFAEELRGVDADPEKLEQVARRVNPLLVGLRTALQKQVIDPPAIQASLMDNKFDEVIAYIVEHSETRQRRILEGSGMSGKAPAIPLWAAFSEETSVAHSGIPLFLNLDSFREPSNQTFPTLAQLASMSRRTVRISGGLLWLIYAVLIVTGGYLLFADKWVGTPGEFVSVFVWAFFTNVGADAATAAFRGLKN
jgi:hypothetical protein